MYGFSSRGCAGVWLMQNDLIGSQRNLVGMLRYVCMTEFDNVN